MGAVAIVIAFLLGIANFALHMAAMESRSALLGEVPWLASRRGRQIAFLMEFAVLLSAMLLVSNGWPNILWGYLAYSAVNGVSAWLMLSGRV